MKKKWMMIVVALSTVGLVAAGCSSQQPTEDEAPVEQEQPGQEEMVEEQGEQEEETPAEEEEMAMEEHEEGDIVVGSQAVAAVMNAEGEEMGQVRFTQLEEGVQVEGSVSGLEPGLHGFHVHENGVCEGPDFSTAGGHYNPKGHQHGAPDDDSESRHAGDFGNIEADENGVAEFSFIDPVITLGGAMNNVIDHALIVHEGEDDLVSQPTGDAGGRAGCGLIEAS